MINPIKHNAVNWVDGMKISQRHFDAHTNFTLDSLRDVSSLYINNFNYGLLPISDKSQDKGIFEVFNTLTGDVQLVIKQCSAVTPAGFRIELSKFSTNLKSLAPQASEELQEQKEDYYLIISVNPFDKIPHGDVDLEETPPRHPFTKPSYHIELMPVSSFDSGAATSGGNYIIIGKATVQGNSIQADTSFIPPCTSVLSHPLLLNYYNSVAKTMAILQQYAIRIIQKNINTSQNTKLAFNVKLLCHALVNHIGNIYFQFRNVIPHVAPIYLIECFSQLSIHLYNTTQSISSLELEEMLNYVSEWSEVAPHTFLNQLSAVAEINYQHTDCGAHLKEVQLLLVSLEKIFLKLSELDYIGQRKENIIVNELDVTPVAKTNRGWSVLD